MKNLLTHDEMKKIVDKTCFEYSIAGQSWSDGLLLGNGNIGAVAYAPNSMEWVINKLDVVDGRL